MKQRPILFSAPMVRALLDGTKTQTRRLVAHPGEAWTNDGLGRITSKHPKQGRFGLFVRRGLDTDFPECDIVPCPYGQPGDRLWVRETWAYGIHALAAARDENGPFVYAADGTTQGRLCDRWRPSIHMPRTASRITLEVTGVRVERLLDISIEDAKAEGAWGPDDSIVDKVATYFGIDVLGANPRLAFQMLWESINGPGSWDLNPWVWAIDFKRLEQPA